MIETGNPAFIDSNSKEKESSTAEITVQNDDNQKTESVEHTSQVIVENKPDNDNQNKDSIEHTSQVIDENKPDITEEEESPYEFLKTAYIKRPSVDSNDSSTESALFARTISNPIVENDVSSMRGSLVALRNGKPGEYSGYGQKNRSDSGSQGGDNIKQSTQATVKPRSVSAPPDSGNMKKIGTNEPVRPPRKSKPKGSDTDKTNSGNKTYDKLWSYMSKNNRKLRKSNTDTSSSLSQRRDDRYYDAVFDEDANQSLANASNEDKTSKDHQYIETGIRIVDPADRDSRRPPSAVIFPMSLNEEMESDTESWGSEFDESDERVDDNEIYDVIGQDTSLQAPSNDDENSVYDSFDLESTTKEPSPPLLPPRRLDVVNVDLDEDKILYVEVNMGNLKCPPPRMPSLKSGLTREEIKRHQIIKCIIENEKQYMMTIYKIIDQYERPLKEKAIISQEKIKIIFQHLHEIQQCHQLFNIALSGRMSEWDDNPTIGDIVYSSFSKSMLIEAYSKYVQNFTKAMDNVKESCLLVPAFFSFLKNRLAKTRVKQSLYDLLRQPLERVPQLVILIQELLKVSPSPNNDRVPLQMALTQLEGLSEVLSEEKRNTTMKHKVQQLDKYFIGMNKALFSSKRYYTRHDDMHLCVIEHGKVTKTKLRRLFLLSDRLICASLINRAKKVKHMSNKRYKVKWCVPILDVEVVEMGSGISVQIENKTTTIQYSGTSPRPTNKTAKQKLENLQHDMTVIGQISGLVSTLRTMYNVVSKERIDDWYRAVKEKLELETEMANMHWLELRLPTKDADASFLFNIPSSKVKLQWASELENAKLRLSCNNNPGWYLPGNELSSSGSIAVLRKNLPLLAQSVPLFMIDTKLVVECMIEVPLSDHKDPVVWIFSGHEHAGQISIMSMSMTSAPRITEAFVATNSRILCAEIAVTPKFGDLRESLETLVWIGTMSGAIIIYEAESSDRENTALIVQQRDAVICLRRVDHYMFAGMANGMLACFRQKGGGLWDLKNPTLLFLDSSPILSMTEAAGHLWCACANQIHVLNCETLGAENHIEVSTNPKQYVKHLVSFGSGVWVSTWKSCKLQLYHSETYECLQTLNVASPISRMKGDVDGRIQNIAVEKTHITSLRSCEGLLWVGTSVGLILSYRLPRLGGVPLVSGGAFISFHGHEGAVRCLNAFRLRRNLKNYLESEDLSKRKSIFYTGINKDEFENSLDDSLDSVRRDKDTGEPMYFMVEPESGKMKRKRRPAPGQPKNSKEHSPSSRPSQPDSYKQWLKSFGNSPDTIDPFTNSEDKENDNTNIRDYNSDDSIDADQEFSFIEDKTSVDQNRRRKNKKSSTFISVDINREKDANGGNSVVSGDVSSKTSVGGLAVVPETNFSELMNEFLGFEGTDRPNSSTPMKDDDTYETAVFPNDNDDSDQAIDISKHYKYAPLPNLPIDNEVQVVSTPELLKPRLLDLIRSADSTMNETDSSISTADTSSTSQERNQSIKSENGGTYSRDAMPVPVLPDLSSVQEGDPSMELPKPQIKTSSSSEIKEVTDIDSPSIDTKLQASESTTLPLLDLDKAKEQHPADDPNYIYTPLINTARSEKRQDGSFDGIGVREYDNDIALSASLVKDSPEKYYATLLSVSKQDDQLREGLLMSPLYFVSIGSGRVDLKKKAKSAGMERLKSFVTPIPDPEMLIWKVTS